MKNRRAFRPELAGLEARTLSTAGLYHPSHPRAAAAAAAPVVPVPGGTIAADSWSSLHAEFVARAVQQRPPVVFLGDSITYFWTDAGRTPLTATFRDGFPAPRGAAPWASTFAPLGAANFGIPGDLTANLLWRVTHGEVAGRPKVAVVLIGTNDLIHGQTPRQTADGTIAVAQAIRAFSPGTKILLVGVLPGGPVPGDPSPTQVSQTNAIVSAWARRNRVAFTDVDRVMTPYIDALNHPVDAGYQVFASALAAPVKRLLGA